MSVWIGEAEVVVVGAGVLGAAAAFELANAGKDVLIIERGQAGLEASGANAGTLAVQNKPLAAIPAVLRAVSLWVDLEERLGQPIEYERRGGLRVAHSSEDEVKLEKAVADQRVSGAPLEILRGKVLREVAPYLHADVRAASYCALDGMANPLATFRAYLCAGRRLGVRLVTETSVLGVEIRGDHEFVLNTGRGAVRTRHVVSAAGAWTRDFVRHFGVDLPLGTEVLQASITDSHTPLFSHIVTHVQGNLTLKQQRSGRILVGGAWRGEGDAASGRKALVLESLSGNYKWATDTVPGIKDARVIRAWPGFEGRTPDKLLLAGALPSPKGVYVLGCGGGGFTFSPLVGRLAADFITQGTVEDLARPFNPARFKDAAPPLPAQQGKTLETA